MSLLFWTALALAPTAPGSSKTDAFRLAPLVDAIRRADYRGEREELGRLAAALEAVRDPQLAGYRSYWQGFAQWRRAVNGFNETPMPQDLESDLKAGIASFKAALVARPGWIEARIGILGCAGPLLFLAANDAPQRESILKEYLPLARDMREEAKDNPRALWLQGQAQLGAPPPTGGDPVKAAATFHRGIDAALVEALEMAADEPAWIPRWGGAENLMNLAYLHANSEPVNRELALAYAEGALVAAPEWHYVRDILLPKIRALGEARR